MGDEKLKKVKKAEPTEVPVGEYEQRLQQLSEPLSIQYVALSGLNYGCAVEDPEGTRIEAGEDVPAEVVKNAPWLLEQGHVTVKKGAING
jgi:hypothetical protein